MRDLVERGNVVVDDEVAAHLTDPASGTELSADQPPTFTWSARSSTARHGLTTGEFVWLNITGPGMDAPIDVVAIEGRPAGRSTRSTGAFARQHRPVRGQG